MSTEQKIDNTFTRVMDEVNRLQKAFQPQKNLEKAIAEVGGDISWLKDINEAFDNLYDKLEEGHMGAVAHLQMESKKEIKESVLDSDDDDGFMARSQLYFLARDAINLHGMIDDRSDLEPWVQSKIAQASKDIDAVRRYTEYNAMEQQQEPEVPAVIPGEEPQDEMPSIDVKMEGRLGFSDIEKFGKEKASEIDLEARRRGSADMEPGDADELRYKIAKEMGLVESVKDKEDYQAKKQAIQDIQMDPNTHKDEELKKELMKRKSDLDDEAKKKGLKEEMKFDDKRDAELKVFAKDLYKKAVKKAKAKANK